MMKIRLISSFQHSVVETLVSTIIEAAQGFGMKRIVCGGGVMANTYLRRRLKEEKPRQAKLFITPLKYAGDNAAMVAGLGFYLYNKGGLVSPISLQAEAN